MQNESQNSKEAQGVGTAQQLQEQFNIATQNLLEQFGHKELKPCIDNLLLGWICSDYFELNDTSNRGAIFDFFTNALNYIQKLEIIKKTNENPEFHFAFYDEIMISKIFNDSKDLKKIFKQSLRYFLQSEISNDNDLRNDVTYKVKKIRKYFKKINRLKIQYSLIKILHNEK